jgi:hypothetical protein
MCKGRISKLSKVDKANIYIYMSASKVMIVNSLNIKLHVTRALTFHTAA